ncbi:MAG TPA: hypothetical protein VGJ45_13325 [Pseudonocardiaceae bacterium]|jgi:hypothetical protein
MPQMSLGNGYTIDLADGWTFVHALQDSLREVQDGYQKNVASMRMMAPGNDAHSGSFISSMSQKYVEAHHDWYTAKVNQLGTMIDNMTGILQQYGIAETANTIQWQAPETYNPNDSSGDIPRGHGAV